MCSITNNMKRFLTIFLISSTLVVNAANYNDKIIAIVNDRVILKSEVQTMIDNLSPEIIAKSYSMLSDNEIINNNT